jgi:hypothetical protein
MCAEIDFLNSTNVVAFSSAIAGAFFGSLTLAPRHQTKTFPASTGGFVCNAGMS